MYVGGFMTTYRRNLHSGCKKTKKRLTMKDAYSIWGTKDEVYNIQCDALFKLERLACRSGFKILVIEDDLIQLGMLRDILKDNCFTNVITATSAEEGIVCLLNNRNISLILTDYRMDGDLNGYDVFKTTTDFKLRPMVIIMSGYEPAEILNLKKEGLLFLPKPYKSDNLVTIINKVYVKYIEYIIRGKVL